VGCRSDRKLNISEAFLTPGFCFGVRERVFVVRSAPDLSRFSGGAPDPALKRAKEHLLCYLGVMGPQDGVDYALKSLVTLRALRPNDWHAAFVGSGDCFDQVRALATELGLDDHVTFTGRIPDDELLAYLSTADVALSPDPHSALNDVSTMNKVLEYMACGLPIVSFELREARVSAGEAAHYVPCNDTDALEAATSALLDDPAERQRRGEIGRNRVAGGLSWKHSKAQLLAAYEKALGGSPTQPAVRLTVVEPETRLIQADGEPPSARAA
jgi:glycosyltransferase involved in cell wall biosynthesis